jgi:hypothetical protein
MCGINFSTALGHSAYRSDTNVLPEHLSGEPGNARLVFTLPNVNFGASRLTLSAAVASREGVVFHKLDCAVPVDVAPDLLGQGDLQLETRVAVE